MATLEKIEPNGNIYRAIFKYEECGHTDKLLYSRPQFANNDKFQFQQDKCARCRITRTTDKC